MKICLINPGRYYQPQPPLGLAYLAAHTKKYSKSNHTIKIIDENVGENFKREFLKFQPDIVGITATTQQIGDAIRVANFIKTQSDVPVVVGGAGITSIPSITMKETSFDIGVIGEGEETFLEIIENEARDLKNIKGIIFRDGKEIIMTKPRPLINNLDNIPFPARELLKMEEYYLRSNDVVRGFTRKSTQIMSSRGCPYNCIYCGSKLIWGRTFRPHSPEYVIRELKHLVETYNIEAFFFQDDTLCIDKERVKRICKLMIEEGLNEKLVWSTQLRANLISEKDKELLQLMKNAGCIQVEYGFESCSERILKLLKNNSVTVEQNQKALEVSKQIGLRVLGDFMIGAPTETLEDIDKTRQFLLKNKQLLDVICVSITSPFPGTELWNICEEKGLVSNEDLNKLWMGTFFGSKGFSDVIPEKKLKEIYNEFRFMSMEKLSLSTKFKKALRSPMTFRKLFFDYLYHSLKKPFRDLK
jgi:radical SAM superfamily enzyme YgiQ (UPF0313 family)